jgi:hypothetical protein
VLEKVEIVVPVLAVARVRAYVTVEVEEVIVADKA